MDNSKLTSSGYQIPHPKPSTCFHRIFSELLRKKKSTHGDFLSRKYLKVVLKKNCIAQTLWTFKAGQKCSNEGKSETVKKSRKK